MLRVIMRELLIWTNLPVLARACGPGRAGGRRAREPNKGERTQRSKDAKTPRKGIEDFAPFPFPWGGTLRLGVLAFFAYPMCRKPIHRVLITIPISFFNFRVDLPADGVISLPGTGLSTADSTDA